MVGDDLIVDAPSQDNCDKNFGSIEYKVKIQRAPGGRVDGKGRKDKLNVDWSFQCTCGGYKKSAMCKHIGALAIAQFNWFLNYSTNVIFLSMICDILIFHFRFVINIIYKLK